ncbi:hypothetical protein H0H92_009099, partial [Tricholoma furcatifolium]
MATVTFSQTATSFPTPTLSPNNDNGGAKSATYFFGFLITFAVLLVLFVVAGLISRQRMQARRAAAAAAGIGLGDPWVYGYHERMMNDAEAQRLRPVWMESWLADPAFEKDEKGLGIGDDVMLKTTARWKDIMPLAATLSLPERETEPEEGAEPEPEKPARRGSLSTISSWFSHSSTKNKNPPPPSTEDLPPHEPQVPTDDPEAEVEVVVMIAMPRTPDTQVFEFGVADIPLSVLQNTNMNPHVVLKPPQKDYVRQGQECNYYIQDFEVLLIAFPNANSLFSFDILMRIEKGEVEDCAQDEIDQLVWRK